MEGSEKIAGYALLGPYVVSEKIAAGGMATIHLGRLFANEGSSRTVAVKRLRPELATDAEFVTMFLDESRMARRIHHPNVVETLDVVSEDNEHFIVMEYVHGESLHFFLRALRRHQLRMPLPIVGGVLGGTLRGLHAAHEVRGDDGGLLGLVHRDVSPHNLLLGVDGRARLLDFGVAKAKGRAHQTRQGLIKGKIQYMSPEQIKGKPLDRRTDIFSAGIVLWESLVSQALFEGKDDAEILARVLRQPIPPPSAYVPVSPEIDALTLRALSRDPAERFTSANDMADAIERAFPTVDPETIGRWVGDAAQSRLLKRSKQVEEVERAASEVRAFPIQSSTMVLPSGALFVGRNPLPWGDPSSDSHPRAAASSSSRERDLAPGSGDRELLPPPSFPTEAMSGRTLPLSPNRGSLPDGSDDDVETFRVMNDDPSAPSDPARISLADIGRSTHPPLSGPRPVSSPAQVATDRVEPAVGRGPPPAAARVTSGRSPSAVQPLSAPQQLVGAGRAGDVDEPSLGRRLATPAKLFMAAVALVVFESILSSRVGVPLRIGFLTPSLVAGGLAAASIMLGVWAVVGGELTGRSSR